MKISPSFHFETNRLVLRRMAVGDLDDFFTFRTDPVVTRFQGEMFQKKEEAATFIDGQKANTLNPPGRWLQLAIARKKDDQIIGDMGVRLLLEESRMVEIGFTVAPDQQRNGYGSEALHRLVQFLFEEQGVHKIIGYAACENDASIGLLKKIGFRREGHLLQNYCMNGRWIDEFLFGMLMDDFQKSRK